jgi:very-short-patch-repair endonuclease
MALKKGPTSIEKLLMDELGSRGILYIPQYKIAHWFVDIALREHRIAIEADGDYWHRSEKQKQKDANKDHWLIAHKWKVYRFTETEIRASASACIDRIITNLILPVIPHSDS